MSQYLGDISAYALAVSQGYTGTEEEYAELMASYATVGQTAVTAAQTATTKASEAATSATTATNKASEATTAATTATTKAGEASTSASTATSAKDTAVSASQTATTKATEATTAAATAVSAKDDAVSANTAAQSAKTAAQTAQTGAETAAASVQSSAEQIATNAEDISQLKSNLTTMESDGVVPSAEQLLSDKGVTDSVPYHFRKTASDNADREELEIVGGSVAWNQLVPIPAASQSASLNGITITDNRDGSYVINGTTTAVTRLNIKGSFNGFLVDGHKYIGLGVKSPLSMYDSYSNKINFNYKEDVIEYSNPTNASVTLSIYIPNSTTYSNITIKPMIFDLTAMFGTTIADHIYSLEQATAGAGVALFRSLFPKDYYAYDAGSMQSVSGLSAHKMTGFNQWDEEWELGWVSDSGTNIDNANIIRSKNYIPVFPSTDYYFKTPQTSTMVFFDRNKNCLGHIDANGLSDITAGGAIRKTLDNCYYIRIWVRNSTAYNHDICINLSDPTKNGQYKPYEEHGYPLDSTLTLRGLFKLDANNNLYADGDTYEYTGKVTRNTILRAYQSGDESLANAITDGTNTVVYSANASTEQADPYQHLQQCDPNGTEEYVSTGIVPVGHNTQYPENLRAKIEGLPWNFASLIAPTESTFVATRNYTTGALFIVDNVLYKATSNIANGGTITPNTNCTATTLAEIISALA